MTLLRGLAVVLMGLVAGCRAEAAADDHDPKAFALFSVVSFDNEPCTSNSVGSNGNRNGTCFTATECTDKSGSASGTCATGFGVCCVFTISGTGSQTVNQNCTYVRNPSYPSVYSDTTSITYTVNKVSEDVCMLRLDFESFTIVGPSLTTEVGGGVCPDTFIVSSSADSNLPTVCGKNTGQHMYVDMGLLSGDTASLKFTFSGTSTVRAWEIKVTQIHKSQVSKPPTGCLQYHMTPTGRLTTFNFLETTTGSINHLLSQNYQICIRQEEGYCHVAYEVCPDESNAYSIDSVIATAGDVGSTCTLDHIEITGSSVTCTSGSSQIINSRYCGGIFGPLSATVNAKICDCTPPFMVGIKTDTVTDSGAIIANTAVSRGVCLDFKQEPC